MLIRDIVRESTMNNLEADLNGLLISAKANGVSGIATDKLVQQMRNFGYSIDTSSILVALENSPLIQVATVDSVQFANTNVASASGDADSKKQIHDKVENKAQKTALKSIKGK